MLRTPWSTMEMRAMKVAGTSEVKERATPSGTTSGSLMTMFFWTQVL